MAIDSHRNHSLLWPSPCGAASLALPAFACCPSGQVGAGQLAFLRLLAALFHCEVFTANQRKWRDGRSLGPALLAPLPGVFSTFQFPIVGAGMRFIVNLGRSSTVRFPGAKQRTGGRRFGRNCSAGDMQAVMLSQAKGQLRACAGTENDTANPGRAVPALCPALSVAVPGVKRRQRAPAVKLTFRPVNNLLQGVYQVGGWLASCMYSFSHRYSSAYLPNPTLLN